MRLVIRSLTVSTSALLVFGCSGGTPECSDASVKNAVLEIAADKFRDAFFYESLKDHRLAPIGAAPLKYSDFKDGKDPAANEAIADVDKSMNRISVSIESIRTQERDEARRTVSCAANLALTGPAGSQTIPIKYSAQHTDDGKDVYVEVSGLH